MGISSVKGSILRADCMYQEIEILPKFFVIQSISILTLTYFCVFQIGYKCLRSLNVRYLSTIGKWCPFKSKFRPAVVAWFVKASVFHSVNSAPSVNGGSNPAWECCIDRLNSKEFVAIQIARHWVLFKGSPLNLDDINGFTPLAIWILIKYPPQSY